MLGRLQRDRHPGQRAEPAGPHPGAVHHDLALEVPGGGPDAGHLTPGRTLPDREAGDGHPLDDRHALLAGPPGQGHGDVHRIGATVPGDVEPGQDVVHPGRREQVPDLGGGDLLHLDAEVPIERGDPPVLLEPAGIGGDLDEADRGESRRLPRLGLQPGVQVPGVLPHPGRGLRRRAERHDQTRRVPGGAGGEPVAFEQDHVTAARVREVIGDRGPDHAAADHDDPGPVGQRGSHGRSLGPAGGTVP